MTDITSLSIARPDDWHVHLRDGDALGAVVADTARQFARAIVMPNLSPPVVNTADALSYRERILEAAPPGGDFTPLMTLYLTDRTSPDDILAASDSEHVHGVKLYPAGATTNSDAGVTDIANAEDALAAMSECGLPLLVHGEVTGAQIDVFEREAEFIEQIMIPVRRRFPSLRVVFEHITTRAAAQYVRDASGDIAATITPQHLLLNRNALFAGGLRPHNYCLPVLKMEADRRALVEAATGGNPRFFLGTDSAPHAQSAKENACGCAGMYTARTAIELYAEVFEAAGRLDRLEGFASHFGPDFYGLPRNTSRIALAKREQTVPQSLPFAGTERLVPFRAGHSVAWQFEAIA